MHRPSDVSDSYRWFVCPNVCSEKHEEFGDVKKVVTEEFVRQK